MYDGFDSLAHGWSTGPVSILTRHTLGVRPLAPGYSTVLVAPQPGPVHRAEGRVPTPVGNLDVSWHREGAVFSLSLLVPDGMRAVVGIPSGQVLLHNGNTAVPEVAPASFVSAGLDVSPLLFITAGPGSHTIANGYQLR